MALNRGHVKLLLGIGALALGLGLQEFTFSQAMTIRVREMCHRVRRLCRFAHHTRGVRRAVAYDATRNWMTFVPQRSVFAYAVTMSLLIAGAAILWIAPEARAVDGVVKEVTFLLHSVNETETAKPLPGGGSTLTYFDTTLEFNDVNVTLTASGTNINFDFYLVPPVAGNFTVSGYNLKIWSKFVSGASNEAQVSVRLYDREPSATEALLQETNYGSEPFSATPELKVFSTTIPTHTFQAGHSIKLQFSITPGFGKTFEFYYDTAQVNSRVGFMGPDSLDVEGITALDANRNPSLNFDPEAADKTVFLQARVTDPLGGYDVRWVNLTLRAPSGALLLDNVSMEKVAGTPVGFESTFEFPWNYSLQPIGRYEVLAWALDNNGHNHYFFFQTFTYAEYPDVGTAAFFVGGPTVYVNVKPVDSRTVALAGATVLLVSGGFTTDAGTTDTQGLVNLSVPTGSYTVEVWWQEVRVAALTQDLQENVTEQSPIVVTTAVYYPIFRAEDADGVVLGGATLLLTHPNGERLGPYRADEDGEVDLAQLPAGSYGIVALWRGVEVFSGSRDVSGDGAIPIPTAVYNLTVQARGGDGKPLAGVFVSVADGTGLVFDAELTDGGGNVFLRLPAGDYTVRARYVTSVLGTLYDSGTRTQALSLSSSTTAQVTFEDFPVPFTGTLAFLFALLYVSTIIGLVAVLYLLHRRRAPPSPATVAGK